MTYWLSKEDSQSEDNALGSLSVRGMRVEGDVGREEGPEGALFCFAITPAAVDANQGHIRRIVCGCQTQHQQSLWSLALTAARDETMKIQEKIMESEAVLDDDKLYATFNILTAKGGLNGGRTFCFRVENEEKREEWISGLQEQVEKAKHEEEMSRLHNPLSRLRRKARRLYENARAQVFFAAIIVLSFVATMTEAERLPPPGTFEATMFIQLEVACSIVFSCELFINLFANWWRRFLNNRWDLFDLFVVPICWVGVLAPSVPGMNLIRFLRVFRVIKLFRWNKSLGQLVTALGASVLPLINSLAILNIVTALYAVVATNLYQHRHPEYFGTLTTTYFTMLQIATADSWYANIGRSLTSPDGAVDKWASLFLVTYVLICGIVLMNIVVAVLLDEFLVSRARESIPTCQDHSFDVCLRAPLTCRCALHPLLHTCPPRPLSDVHEQLCVISDDGLQRARPKQTRRR